MYRNARGTIGIENGKGLDGIVRQYVANYAFKTSEPSNRIMGILTRTISGFDGTPQQGEKSVQTLRNTHFYTEITLAEKITVLKNMKELDALKQKAEFTRAKTD